MSASVCKCVLLLHASEFMSNFMKTDENNRDMFHCQILDANMLMWDLNGQSKKSQNKR